RRLDPQPGGAYGVDQAIGVAKTGLPQRVDGRLDRRVRVLAAAPVRRDRRTRQLRIVVPRVRGDACLHGDRGDRVAHDVVQLPGDPQALLGDLPGAAPDHLAEQD